MSESGSTRMQILSAWRPGSLCVYFFIHSSGISRWRGAAKCEISISTLLLMKNSRICPLIHGPESCDRNKTDFECNPIKWSQFFTLKWKWRTISKHSASPCTYDTTPPLSLSFITITINNTRVRHSSHSLEKYIPYGNTSSCTAIAQPSSIFYSILIFFYVFILRMAFA